MSLEIGGGGIHFRLQLLQVLERQLAIDVGLHLADITLQPAEEVA